LDLKSASNCKAVKLVQSLVSVEWFDLLSKARVGTTVLPDGSVVQLQMFAGMGNGFTFPLESIIFYALARASADVVLGEGNGIVSVYGDDIIVETAVVPLLTEVLAAAGFWINLQKSFIDGPFRESCGADYFEGIDVRPVYVKTTLTPAGLFSLHNGLFRRGEYMLAEMVHNLVHPALRLYGPDGYGDGHLLSQEWESYLRPQGRRRGFGGFVFDTFATVAKRDWTYHPGDRILPHYSVYMRGETPAYAEGEDARYLREYEVPGLPVSFSIADVHRTSGAACRFLRAWMTGHGDVAEPSLEIPFGVDESSWGPVVASLDELDPYVLFERGWQGQAKAVTFPGVEWYTKTTIYITGK